MTTETKSTWTHNGTAGHETHGQSAVYCEETGKSIAIVYDGKSHAPLVSAAPDLLEACKQSLITLDPMDKDHVELYRLLTDAIAKASA